mgnify:CR=1 FL=1
MLYIQGIRSHKLLPVLIQTGMWLWVPMSNIRRFFCNLFHKDKKKYLKYIKCNNHFSGTNHYKEWEAIEKGVVKVPYTLEKHHYAIEWIIPIKATRHLEKFLDNMVGRGYEFMNFFWHTVKIFTGIWFGPTDMNKFSCVELVNALLIEAGYTEVQLHWNPYETQVLYKT